MINLQVHLTLPAWVHEMNLDSRVLTDPAAQVGLAIELSARNIAAKTGGPFGAALFDQDGRVLGVGVNRVEPSTCSVAHAEMMAYMSAQQRTQNFRLNADGRKVTLATSSQPCCMCYGATVWAGVDRLLIGARSEDVERLTEFDEGPLPADWIGALVERGITVERDVEREAACKVLADYSAGGGLMY
jgi:tRNA(Arg) A34 adenosine deaminase TadA